MIKKYEITEEEFDAIVKAISDTLGWYGDNYSLTCGKEGRGTSMSVETFKNSLRERFIII